MRLRFRWGNSLEWWSDRFFPFDCRSVDSSSLPSCNCNQNHFDFTDQHVGLPVFSLVDLYGYADDHPTKFFVSLDKNSEVVDLHHHWHVRLHAFEPFESSMCRTTFSYVRPQQVFPKGRMRTRNDFEENHFINFESKSKKFLDNEKQIDTEENNSGTEKINVIEIFIRHIVDLNQQISRIVNRSLMFCTWGIKW